MKQANTGIFKFALSAILISGLFGVGFGLFLLLIDVSFLMKIVFVLIGVLTVFNNLPALIFSALDIHTREGIILFILSLFATAMGVAMIFFHNWVLMVVLGVYFVLIPILRILRAPQRQVLSGSELPKVILGVIMLLLGPASVMSVLFRIAGIVIIALCVVYMLVAIIFIKKTQNKTGHRIFVDETGDGKADTIYIDVNEDGKPDYTTTYRDDK